MNNNLMREILFRGKRDDNGQWIKGYYCGPGQLLDVHEICDIDDTLMSRYEIDPETLGQYTELPDKNGRMIFDGDILKEMDIKVKPEDEEIQIAGHVWMVTMTKGCWCVRNNEGWDFLSSNARCCEVIGNIHDNPELLEGMA